MPLPCLALLEATPGVLRGLTVELSAQDVRWKPAPDRFSVGEVLAHLAHSEDRCYRARLDRLLLEELPVLAADHASQYLALYAAANPEESVAAFEARRAANVQLLRSLPDEAAARRALHEEVGEITLASMLHEWALHDLGHVRQVAELVRSRRYLAGAGPLARYYSLTP